MFIRDSDNEDNRVSKTTGLFTMAEFCQVFLTAKYVREEDDSFIPLIERGKLHKMPKAVAEEMDKIYQVAVNELQQWGEKPEEFFEKLEKGDIDPISDFIDQPEMRTALGNVVMRRLTIVEGIRGEEAYEEAKKILPEMRDQLYAFVNQLMLHGMKKLTTELLKRNIPFTKVGEVLKPRVELIAEDGIVMATKVDYDILDEIEKNTKEKEERKVKYDPAWG